MSEADRQSAPQARAPLDVRAVASLLFFFSGAATLIYQIAFLRGFVELYGSTSAALASVVGAFFVCLTLGALVAGLLADRSTRPLRLYALLELVAGCGGLAAWQALRLLDSWAGWLAARELAGDSVAGLRFLLALGVLLIPVGALGGTLPVLARYRRGGRRRGVAAGVLQGASTAGAALGVLVASLVLVPELGIRQSVAVAACMNLILAAVAAKLWREVRGAPQGESPPAPSAEDPAPAWPYLAAALGSGFVLLATEVLFFRGVEQVSRGGLDSLGILLATFLLANAGGAALGTLLSRRARLGFALGNALGAAAVLLGLALLSRIASGQAGSWLSAGQAALTYPGRLAGEALTTLLVAGPVAFAAGIAFPCVCQLRPRRPRGFGTWVALLSGLWTTGALIASFLVPAVVLPRFGLHGGLLVCAALPLVCLALAAAAEGWRAFGGRPLLVVGASLVLLAAAVGSAGGVAPLLAPLEFYRSGLFPDAELLAYGEGALANVAVVGLGGSERVLKVNNRFSLGGSGAQRVERMQAILPHVLAGKPGRALVLGLGAGTTVGTLLELGMEHVDVVELEPLVLKSLPFFEEGNHEVLAAVGEGRVTLIETDARTFVRGAPPESYDLIVGDLFFPWQPAAGFLYTVEHFRRVRRLLTPEGLFCQWLPLHQLGWEEFGLVGRTFSQVFRGTTAWLARPEFPFPVVALMAGKDDLEVDVKAIETHLEEHPRRDLLERHGVSDVYLLLSLYLGGNFLFRAPNFESEAINTEDRALVEFAASRRTDTDGVLALHNRRRLGEVREDVVGRISTVGLETRERAALQQKLTAAARRTGALFEAETLRLLAHANRQLPEAQRQNDPEQLEVKAFQTLGGVLREFPRDQVALDHVIEQLKDRLAQQEYISVVEATSSILANPGIGETARLHNLRGMALLLAASSPQAEAFNRPLELAAVEFRAALEEDATMVEAAIHLGIVKFLSGREEEALALLADARSRIEASGDVLARRSRATGMDASATRHALPLVPEAIYLYLTGHEEQAVALAASAATRLPYVPSVLARMQRGSS